MAQTPPRFFSFFPALPLARNLELGDWIAGTPPAEVPWASARFRELSEALIGSFEKRQFRDGARLWHRDRGFDGTRPSDEEIYAIQAAVTFAVLDANDRLTDDGNKAHFLATTENGDLFIQPIAEEDGGITHVRRGELKQISVAGFKIGGDPPPLPDAVEPILGRVPVSGKLAGAIFTTVRSSSTIGPVLATAAEWHRIALANPAAVTVQQRLIALKTGFEALLHEEYSRDCARLLRQLFERATAAHRDILPWIGVLWSPTELTLQRTHRSRKGKTTSDPRSELEDWFMALAEARNAVIHTGRLTTGTYGAPPERPLSRYAGSLFWTGERVLREAIKATLGPEILLCGAIERREWAKATFDALVAQNPKVADAEETQDATRSPGVVAAAAPEESPRTLSVLLAEIGCQSANFVTISMVPGSNKWWGAEVPGRSMRISGAERDILKAAGAEDELPGVWMPCE